MQNIGSIIKIEIIQADYIIVSTPDENNQVTTTVIGNWQELPFQQESASFNEVEKQVDEGVRYDSELQFVIPKVYFENYKLTTPFSKKPVVIKITDGNGTSLLLGSDKIPAYVLRGAKIPSETSGLNNYKFSVKYKNPLPAPFVA